MLKTRNKTNEIVIASFHNYIDSFTWLYGMHRSYYRFF